MQYSVAPEVFALDPRLRFGIIIGWDVKNRPANTSDLERLRRAEDSVRKRIQPEDLRSWPTIAFYRELMAKAGINPNRFPVSVEAMLKRVLKGDSLPSINALVDLCNAVSMEYLITLGAHDLYEIREDLAVRFSYGGERFQPFGQKEEEVLEAGELIFTSGSQVQTRKWIWRQSELGKTSLHSNRIIFQLVGMDDGDDSDLVQAMKEISSLITESFGGGYQSFLVNPDSPVITFRLNA